MQKTILFLLFFFKANSINIEQFGAVSNSTTYETAIQNGIAFKQTLIAANKSTDDRTVLIEANKVYTLIPFGLVENLVNVEILLEGELSAWNGDILKWPQDQYGHSISLILLRNTQRLVIKGNGLINGNGNAWWLHVILTGKDNRPNLVDISVSKNTQISGIRLINSPQYHLFLMDQLDLNVENISIHIDIRGNNSFIDKIPLFPLNTDGIDISGRNIYMRNLSILNFDDAVAVKALNAFESNFTNCTENVLVEDSFIKYGVGMSVGSVTPNLYVNCIRNVTFRNIKFEKPLKAIYIKANPGDNGYGLIRNITYENIEINNAIWWPIFVGPQQQKQPHMSGKSCPFLFPIDGSKCNANPRVTISDITFKNININSALLSPGIFICNSTNPCINFVFDNINVYNRSIIPFEKGFFCENVKAYVTRSNVNPNCN